MSDQPPRYSPMKAFTKKSLLWVGIPVALFIGLLFSFWLSETRTQRYIQGTADQWHAMRERVQRNSAERQREEEARQKAIERDRLKAR